MNEKPVMYHNKILKEINNNRKVYNGLDKIDKSSLNKKDVIKKINDNEIKHIVNQLINHYKNPYD